MSYRKTKTTLVARTGYGGDDGGSLGGVWDAIKTGAGNLVSGVNQYYQDKGAAQYYSAGPGAQQQPGGGSDWLLPVALIGGAGLVLFMVMRKKG